MTLTVKAGRNKSHGSRQWLSERPPPKAVLLLVGRNLKPKVAHEEVARRKVRLMTLLGPTPQPKQTGALCQPTNLRS